MSGSAAPPQGQGQPVPPLLVNIQYVKDLSFEVPGAPMVYTTLRGAPRVDINLDVQVRRIQDGQNVFEVTLAIRVEAHEAGGNGSSSLSAVGGGPGGARVFMAELAYSGIFTINNTVPETAIEPMLLVECPRLLFPFARNILSDVTRDGGFPPVLLQPIDFVSLWQNRRAQATASGIKSLV